MSLKMSLATNISCLFFVEALTCKVLAPMISAGSIVAASTCEEANRPSLPQPANRLATAANALALSSSVSGKPFETWALLCGRLFPSVEDVSCSIDWSEDTLTHRPGFPKNRSVAMA